MQDDIDWLNASSDFGLVELCREMAAIARPVELVLSMAPSRAGSRRRVVRAAKRPLPMIETRTVAPV
jgi:hypothetical protein